MNAFTMFFGTITAALILFNGVVLERYLFLGRLAFSLIFAPFLFLNFSLLYLVAIVVATVAICYLVDRFLPKQISFLIELVFWAMFGYYALRFHIHNEIILYSLIPLISFGATLFSLIAKKRYLIWMNSIIGSFLISTLFSLFYHLKNVTFILIFVFIATLAIIIKSYFLKKELSFERN
jgi:hypothetical protein